MAKTPTNMNEGLFIVNLSGLGLSHAELLAIEEDINAAVLKRLKKNALAPQFTRPPGPPMGFFPTHPAGPTVAGRKPRTK